MKTDTEHVEFIREGEKYVYLLDHLELAMTPNQIDRVVSQHNDGVHFWISQNRKRDTLLRLLWLSCINLSSDTKATTGVV